MVPVELPWCLSIFPPRFSSGCSIMATSMTKVGGVVVITQVIQQDDTSIPLQSSPQATPTCPPAAPPAKRSPPPAPKKLDDFSLAFLQGGPQALGVSFSGPWEGGGGVIRPGGLLPGALMDFLCCR